VGATLVAPDDDPAAVSKGLESKWSMRRGSEDAGGSEAEAGARVEDEGSGGGGEEEGEEETG
jgi:hypothetical protein